MSEDHPRDWKNLDLTSACRILENAGRRDPASVSKDPSEQLQYIIDCLCDLSVHDGLTGLVNATFFHAVLNREIERSMRTAGTCGLMVIDIDHFKNINDTYGHSVGDKVIQSVAAQMKKSMRSMDTAARIGGEEFAIILPECTPEDALKAATRIHASLNPFTATVDDIVLKLTTSVGLVWTDPNATAITSSVMLSLADQEMYLAKRSGRGRMCYRHTEPVFVSSPEKSALMNISFEERLNG
jgi:diguanylate cyclase (GGDEF)-like protein